MGQLEQEVLLGLVEKERLLWWPRAQHETSLNAEWRGLGCWRTCSLEHFQVVAEELENFLNKVRVGKSMSIMTEIKLHVG